MRSRRRLAIAAILILAAIGGWLWWNRPRPVQMAAYAPSDALIYIEIDDPPRLIASLSDTDSWGAILNGFPALKDLLRWKGLIAWTGLGRARDVVLARSQVALVVLSLETSKDREALNIRPHTALLVETHTNEGRTRRVVEELVGDLAHRVYGAPRIERRYTGEGETILWIAPKGDRQIIAAISGSLVVIGNDEATVQSCLAVKRGERASLRENARLEQMRQRVAGRDSLAFGYVSPQGLDELMRLLTTAYAVQLFDNPRVQSAAAIILPQLAEKSLQDMAWSMRTAAGKVEDRYLFALPGDLAARLKAPLAPSDDPIHSAERMLPSDTYQMTRYNYRDPNAAWDGVKSAVSSLLDPLIAPLAGRVLDAALQPYGIESPRDFLRAAGPEIVTAQLSPEDSTRILIARARDEDALRSEVRRYLGAVRRVSVEGVEVLVPLDPKRRAACFTDDYLIMGPEDHLRRCLQARATTRTLADEPSYREANSPLGRTKAQPMMVTYSLENERARGIARTLASDAFDAATTERIFAKNAYAVTETELVEDGLARRTRSAFGLLGDLIAQIISGVGG